MDSGYSLEAAKLFPTDFRQTGLIEKKEKDKATGSHYMTIIGLYKWPSQQPWKYKYILEVVSWGEDYYIDFDEYAPTLDYYPAGKSNLKNKNRLVSQR